MKNKRHLEQNKENIILRKPNAKKHQLRIIHNRNNGESVRNKEKRIIDKIEWE